jgi:hypothetical protein
MIFTEPRSDICDLALATMKLVQKLGPQSFQDVFKNLPGSGFITLTRADLRVSPSRAPELMWQAHMHNVARHQDRTNPKYRQYPPIEGCALIYEGRKRGVHDGRFILPHHVEERAAPRRVAIEERTHK